MQGFEIPRQRRKRKYMITQDVIDKVPCTQLFGFTPEENRYIQECHKELLTLAMQRNSEEVGFLIDITTWQKWVVFGNGNSIDMSNYPKEEEILRKSWKNHLIFLHNHPNNSNFSGVDLRSFCKHESLYMITAIQNDGNINVLAKDIHFSSQATLFEYNKYVDKNQGIKNVINQGKRLGVLYKFGRCRK